VQVFVVNVLAFRRRPAGTGSRFKARSLAASSGENRMGYRIAVVGATGNVGREMLNILAEREFPADEVVALASRRSLGTECSYGERTLKTQDLDRLRLRGLRHRLLRDRLRRDQAVRAEGGEGGRVVIDNSSLYRYDMDVPLIVPEVNPDADDGLRGSNIIANPNCSTAQMVVALKPLHDRARSSASWSRPTSR
jgi:aspartate-semialdehyde dehydrogenase